MGFYGNITNTLKTQFQFDRVYSNRVEMENKKNSDGVFLGRYVLIEYDKEGFGLKSFYIKDGNAYTSMNYEANTIVRIGNGKNDVNVGDLIFDLNELINVYKCSQGEVGSVANFSQVFAESDVYAINYNIDKDKYGSGRGYDSTVWQKIYQDGVEKYVMIAELNTVVPTFDISADAPTMTPITPHFDATSTNVYYKLHAQPQWGLRVKQAEENENSDEIVRWVNTTYDPATNNWATSTEDVSGAIYYNKRGFEEFTPATCDNDTINSMNITLTASGNKYNNHLVPGETIEAEDIQEISINLPAIGNAVSKTYDVLHGVDRKDSVHDSLQGKLNSLNAIENDAIPVQLKAEGAQVGELVGIKLNGGQKADSTEGLNDDFWISTTIDAATRKFEIKHKYDQQIDGLINIANEEFKQHETTNESNVNDNGDSIQLYYPVIDDAGHVVGRNVETVTLPYGYKVISIGEGSTEERELDANTVLQVAENTQDTITLDSYNKWLKLASDNKAISIAHSLTGIKDNSDKDFGLSASVEQSEFTAENKTFNVPVFQFDKAGHIIKAETNTIEMPYSYQNVTIQNGGVDAATITATNATDTFKLNTNDKWLKLIGNDKTISIAHEAAGTTKTNGLFGEGEGKTLKFGDTFKVLQTGIDEKGHVSSLSSFGMTLPSLSVASIDEKMILTGLAVDVSGLITPKTSSLAKMTLKDFVTETNNIEDIVTDDKLETALNKLQNKYKALSSTVSSNHQSLNDSILAVDSSIDSLDNSLTLLETSVNSLGNSIDTVSNNVGTLRTDVDALQAAVGSGQGYEELRNRIEVLEGRIVDDLYPFVGEEGEATTPDFTGLMDELARVNDLLEPTTEEEHGHVSGYMKFYMGESDPRDAATGLTDAETYFVWIHEGQIKFYNNSTNTWEPLNTWVPVA